MRIGVWLILGLSAISHDAAGQGYGLFPGRQFDVEASPRCLASGDLDGDGDLDLVTGNFDLYKNVSVLLGDGVGGFAKPSYVTVNRYFDSAALGDLNADGSLDLVVTSNIYSQVSIMLGDGVGGFAKATHIMLGKYADSLALGDLNRDGKLDLATANGASNDVSILLGDGVGGFLSPTSFGAGTGLACVALGDLDGDGNLDLATANSGSNDVSILLGNGTGSLSLAATISAGTGPVSLAMADLDGDGDLDIATANDKHPFGLSDISVLLGDGTGGFSAPTSYLPSQRAASIAVGDLSGDGILDLAASNLDRQNVAVLVGDGIGGFGEPMMFGFGHDAPTTLAIGDLDSDGLFDLAVTHGLQTGFVSILLHDCGGYKPFGQGCPGLGGFEPFLKAIGFPGPSQPISLSIGHGFGGQNALLLFGTAQSAIPFGPNGCTLLVAPVVGPGLFLPLGGAGPGNGCVTLTGVVPAIGPAVTFSMQAFCGDPGAPGGFTSTNGLITVYP